MTLIKRRNFLSHTALLLATPLQLQAGFPTPGLFLSAASDAEDQHWVAGVVLQQTEARLLYKQHLPARAHQVAVSQRHGIYIALARRPGNWLVVGATDTGAIHAQLQVPAQRHLFGHGVFSPDEQFFYTTENDYTNMTGDSGLVVEWAVVAQDGKVTLERQREYSTAGVDPHELLLLPDGDTLVVANGGMRTHPDSEREVLNLDTMLPSLVYLNRHTGAVLEQQFLPPDMQLASIRHLDVNAGGTLVFGMQFQGEPFLSVPLVGTHQRGTELRLLEAPTEVQSSMQQYVGAVRFTSDGRHFVASCPRGNLLTFWDSESGALVHTLRSRDGCGLSATPDNLVFSAGTGKLAAFELTEQGSTEFAFAEPVQLFWDNHLTYGGLL